MEPVLPKIQNLWHSIQKMGFWLVLAFMIGLGGGLKLAVYVVDNRLDEAVQLGGIIHKKVVYDIKVRP